MCDQNRASERSNVRRDTNKVFMEGTCDGGLVFYTAKSQSRCEFILKNIHGHTVTKVRLQFRGQLAHHAFMVYEKGQSIQIEGHIKYRRGGHYVIVCDEPMDVERRRVNHTVDEIAVLLAEKVDAVYREPPVIDIEFPKDQEEPEMVSTAHEDIPEEETVDDAFGDIDNVPEYPVT